MLRPFRPQAQPASRFADHLAKAAKELPASCFAVASMIGPQAEPATPDLGFNFVGDGVPPASSLKQLSRCPWNRPGNTTVALQDEV